MVVTFTVTHVHRLGVCLQELFLEKGMNTNGAKGLCMTMLLANGGIRVIPLIHAMVPDAGLSTQIAN